MALVGAFMTFLFGKVGTIRAYILGRQVRMTSRFSQEDKRYKEERSTRMKLNFHSQKPAHVSSLLSSVKLGMFAFFISLSNTNVQATTSFSSNGCNTSFEGIVKNVTRAPLSSLPKFNIKISVERVIKGSVSDEFSVSMIQPSSAHFRVGDRVSVVAHDGLICSIN